MKLYRFLDENKKEVWRIAADLDDIFEIEKHFKKSVDVINAEISNKGFFISDGKKYYVAVEYLEFINNEEEAY